MALAVLRYDAIALTWTIVSPYLDIIIYYYLLLNGLFGY